MKEKIPAFLFRELSVMFRKGGQEFEIQILSAAFCTKECGCGQACATLCTKDMESEENVVELRGLRGTLQLHHISRFTPGALSDSSYRRRKPGLIEGDDPADALAVST